jgi:hypothetical protein
MALTVERQKYDDYKKKKANLKKTQKTQKKLLERIPKDSFLEVHDISTSFDFRQRNKNSFRRKIRNKS